MKKAGVNKKKEPFEEIMHRLTTNPTVTNHACRRCERQVPEIHYPEFLCTDCRHIVNIERNLARAKLQLPEKYRGAAFERIEDLGNIAIVKKRLLKAADERESLYVYGPYGAGKTVLTAALFLELARRPVKVRWRRMIDALGDMRSQVTDGGNPDYILEALYRASKAGALFIDDLGAERVTDWVEDRIYGFIDRVTSNYGWIVITSNYDLGELAQRLGERVASRM